jgi:hypothetical protein
MAKPSPNVQKKVNRKGKSPYSNFTKINGKHSFQKAMPDSFVEYKVRTRHGGEVAFFNFSLAEEMGLIPKGHENELTKELSSQILETFSLMIINEYDLIHKTPIPKQDIRENTYMATRYLQLQHPTKKGETSGDGRSIWNGEIKHKSNAWDISSTGTGATCLSPATANKKKFFKSGDPTISYGCGYSEVDEGLATLFFSEIFHRNNIETERVLAIIEYAKGYSINVRAHKCLLRPSHIFRHLKLDNLEQLTKIIDYYIGKQISGNIWNDAPVPGKNRYKYFLKKVAERFSKMSAIFEDEYIFCWMDWDGDNILMDGGIIDYGSIRQFGLFHHEYRYDDVERFSTTILEQKSKAKYIIQTFAQIIDYIVTGEKKNISSFKNHWSMKEFDETFDIQKNINLVHKIGFSGDQADFLLKSHKSTITNFRKSFSYFEMTKAKKGKVKVPDGITQNAVFCMRDILRELPQLYLARDSQRISNSEFVEIMRSSYAKKVDLSLSSYRTQKINDFQKTYNSLVSKVISKFGIDRQKMLLELSMRSSVINKYDRVTGDSITNVVEKIVKHRPKLDAKEIYKLMTKFTEYQHFDPEAKKKKTSPLKSSVHKKIMNGLLEVVRDFREGL